MLVMKAALAEMTGTFVIIFVGGGSILISEKFPHLFPSFGIALTFGTIVMLMILAIGHLSGAHFNPAVTLALALLKRFPVSQIPIYWFSQCAGGAAAAGLLTFLKRL